MSSKGTTVNISLPAALHQRLQEKLDRQAYGSASEYVCDLIRRDLLREAIDQVDALLLDGINSGPATAMTEGDWKELRRIASRPRIKRPHAQAHAHPTPQRAARSR